MVWYVPPLSPIVNALETDGYEAPRSDVLRCDDLHHDVGSNGPGVPQWLRWDRAGRCIRFTAHVRYVRTSTALRPEPSLITSRTDTTLPGSRLRSTSTAAR